MGLGGSWACWVVEGELVRRDEFRRCSYPPTLDVVLLRRWCLFLCAIRCFRGMLDAAACFVYNLTSDTLILSLFRAYYDLQSGIWNSCDLHTLLQCILSLFVYYIICIFCPDRKSVV